MIRITCDSTADLGDMFKSLDIPFLPLVVTLGKDSYYDSVTIDPLKIFDYVAENKILPKTAARSIEDFTQFFKQFTDIGDQVIHINISSFMSSSYEYASVAAQNLPGVYTIDSLTLSSGTGLLVLYALDLVKLGLSAEEILLKVRQKVKNVQASFVVDTMNYLNKGGRCTSVQYIASTLLKIKPTILVKAGFMIVGKKYVGNFDKIILKYVEDTFKNYPTPDYSRIFITHTYSSSETVEAVKNKILSIAPFKEILITKAGSTITSHCGKNTLGILFMF